MQKNNFCIAPWVNIHVDVSERIKPCCNGAGIAVAMSDIDEYVRNTNKNLINLKQELLQNKLPDGCKGCQERNWYSEFDHVKVNSPEDSVLHSMDFRWANTCQLTCTYCNEFQSSSWAALKQKSIPIVNYRVKQGKQKLFDLIESQKNQIKRVSLLGGEPLLLKENLDVLNILSDSVQVDIFSNLNLDVENNLIFSKLIKRSNVRWHISMENIGNKFEFVRRNSSWDQQVKNIEFLLKHSQSKFVPVLQSQFCVYSATSMLEFYQWANHYDLKINWNWLMHPTQLDFKNFPDHYKLESLNQIQEIKNIKKDSLPNLDHIVEQLESSIGYGTQHHVDRCIKWHRDRESMFFNGRLNFENLWTESVCSQ